MSASDIALLERWLAHRDAEAFAELVSRHTSMVYATCRRILRNDADAEEIAQECFVNLIRSSPKRAGGWLSLGGWLHTTATRRCLDRLRSGKRRKVREDRYANEHPPVEEPEWDDVQRYVDEIIADLPEKLRYPVVAHFLEGETHAEVAQKLGISRSTVTSRIAKGIDLVRKRMKRRGITITVSALASLLTIEAAEAAPPALSAALGKMALTAWHLSATTTAGTASITGKTIALGGLVMSTKKVILAVAVLALILGGVFVAPKLLEQNEVDNEELASQTQVDASDGAETATRPVEVASTNATVTEPESSGPDAATSANADEQEKSEDSGVADEVSDSISGKVIDMSGEPVAGAKVNAAPLDRQGAEGGASTSTDAEGKFKLSDLKKGTYTLAALKPGEGFGYENGVSTGTENAIIKFTATGRVSGKVYDAETQAGLTGVFVFGFPVGEGNSPKAQDLVQAQLPFVEDTVSGEDGLYEIYLPAPCKYWLMLEGDTGDYVKPDPLSTPRIDLEPEQHLENINFALVKGGSISGTVYGPDGSGVPGAQVSLMDKLNDQGGAKGKARTDEKGTYSFRGRKLGATYVVRAAHRNMGAASSQAFALRATEGVTGIDIFLSGGHKVAGQVVTSDGKGVKGLQVDLIEAGGHPWREIEFMNAVTGNDGSFAIMNVMPGEYQACVQTAGRSTKVKGPTFTMHPDSDVQDLVIDIGFAVEGFVTGKVMDSSGKPVASAEVVFAAGNVTGATDSGKDGVYKIEGVGGVEFLEYIQARGFRTGYSRQTQNNIPVNSEGIDFVLAKSGSLKGRVVDAASGRPVEKFEVKPGRGSWQSFSSPDGEFALKQLDVTKLVLRARAEGYTETKTERITLPEGETVENVTIALQKGQSVSGIVLSGKTGQPVKDARIKTFVGQLRYETLNREFGWGANDPITDENGHFELTGIEPGRPVNLVAYHSGYAPTVFMSFIPDPNQDMQISLPEGATVTGTVLDGKDLVSSAFVVCYRDDLRENVEDTFKYQAFAQTDQDGAFTLPHIPEGRYYIACMTSATGNPSPAWTERAVLGDGEKTEYTIQLADTGDIVGKIIDAPQEGTVQVLLMSSEWPGEPYFKSEADKKGDFKITGIQAGQYTLRAIQGEKEASQPVTVSAGVEITVLLEF